MFVPSRNARLGRIPAWTDKTKQLEFWTGMVDAVARRTARVRLLGLPHRRIHWVFKKFQCRVVTQASEEVSKVRGGPELIQREFCNSHTCYNFQQQPCPYARRCVSARVCFSGLAHGLSLFSFIVSELQT